MRINEIIDKIRDNPVIAAVRKEENLETAINSPVTTVFLLHSDIFSLKGLVDKITDSGKLVFVHFDFIEGLSKDQKGLEFLAKAVSPDGIISTRSSIIKFARHEGLFTVQRFFLVDSQSRNTMFKAIETALPHMIEIMPAIIPGILKNVCGSVSVQVIAGGLIESKKDIMEVLSAGVLAVSIGRKELWEL
jgi:glycerol uptake operon antiterminator